VAALTLPLNTLNGLITGVVGWLHTLAGGLRATARGEGVSLVSCVDVSLQL
jgi:hypothetical protein